MNSVVDPHKHAKRKKAIMKTWGENRTVGRLEYIFRFVEFSREDDLEETRVFWSELRRAVDVYGARLSWLMKCDDITFVVVEHLHRYLGVLERKGMGGNSSKPVLAGNLLSAPRGFLFMSGGAGVLVNYAAMKGMVLGTCFEELCGESKKAKPWWASAMDIVLTQCAIREFDNELELVDAVDSALHRAYFNAFGPVRLVRGKLDHWYNEYKANAVDAHRNSHPIQPCCAPHPVTFHYVESDVCEFLHKLIHSPYTRTDLHKVIRQNWPRHVGGHAAHPKVEKEVAILAELFLNMSVV